MKKNIFLVISAMLVFGLAVAAYAYYGSPRSVSSAAMACCCHNGGGESCPTKHKDASSGEMASCCDNCECCKGGGESCPMKTDASGAMTGHKHDDASCPMKMQDASASDVPMKHEMKHGEGCCCPCCNKNKAAEKTTDTSGV